MQQKPVLKLTELFYNDGTTFVPSEKEQKLTTEINQLFRDTAQSRDRNFQYFDGLNLVEYINDSVRRFNTNIDEREGIEDWQAGVHDPFTRNKVLGILGRVLEALPIASMTSRGEEPPIKGEILTELYSYAEEQDDYDELMIHMLLEAIVKGTAIGYEDIEYTNRKIRDVEGIGDEITVTENEVKTTKFVGAIVPLEEFYPSSVSIRKVSKMPFCFWRKVIPYATFMDSFGHYKKSELVEPKRSFSQNEPMPYYYDLMDGTLPDGSVELIKYYDRMNDQYVIMANGIWINPIIGGEVMPLPWSHKELPFWDIKYDIFGDFFYGKGLPDRLKSMQDVLNVLTNMLLDQSFLSIFPPLLTAGIDDIEDDYLRPGRRTPVDTQGMPLSNAFQVLQMPTPQGWHQFILQYTRQVMEESSMDKVSQGVAGQGDRTTAYEIRQAAAGVAAMLQLFARFINGGLKRKAYLKTANLLQFGFNPDSPIVEWVLKDKSDSMGLFQSITSKGVPLTGGKRGTRILEMYESKEQLPARETLKARSMLTTLETGGEVEIMAITPEYIRGMAFDVVLVTDPRNEKTRQADQIMQVEKAKLYTELFGDMLNRQELAATTMEKFGDDPSKLLQQQQPAAPMMPGQEQAGMGNGARSIGTPDQGAQEIAQLQALMTQ